MAIGATVGVVAFTVGRVGHWVVPLVAGLDCSGNRVFRHYLPDHQANNARLPIPRMRQINARDNAQMPRAFIKLRISP
jgi:hypothetical protein